MRKPTSAPISVPYVYGSDPLSYSVFVDKSDESKNDTNFTVVQSRSLESWQDDTIVFKCNKCQKGLYKGYRHHCRHCGRLFCSNCSSQTILIPEFVKLPKATNGHSKEDRKKPLRVCDDCYKRIVNIPQPSKDAPVSIDQLLIWKEKEDTLQRQWANYQLSKFRQTQYSMVGHVSLIHKQQTQK